MFTAEKTTRRNKLITPGKKKKIIIGGMAGIAVCVCLLFWFLYQSHFSQAKADVETLPLVRTLTVKAPMDGVERYAYSGEVRSRHESQLAFQIDSKIIARNVELGSIVKQGQTLMQIDAKDVEQIVNSQQAQVAQAKSQLQLAGQNLKRYLQLFTEDVISRSQLEQYQTAYDVAVARHEQTLALHKQSTHQMDYTRLKADKAGVVSTIIAEVGQVVSPGQVVVTVVQDGEREVEINVSENRIDAIRASSLAKITFWALPNVIIDGKIREIAPMADAVSRTYRVRVALLQQPSEIRLGMTATVQITNRNGAPETLYIPLSALYQTRETPNVWIVNNGVAHLRPVKIGVFGNDQVQVLSGLNPGDVIATAGVHMLREGQKVKAITGEK
jgi:membrane fusion protein, multidrug efflux system